MQSPDEAPKLPKLPFFLGDAALLATAVVIGLLSDTPLTTGPLVAMVVCVALGAILAAVPFLADYARRQDATLTERQESLEALVRTTSAAAEQISIATAGFHEVAELAQKNLKAAEHLPHRLQEKINEFNQQLNESAVAENETLQQEIATLRASEAEKLESAADKIHKLSAEFAKLDAATQASLAAAAETLSKLPSLAEQARELLASQVATVVPAATHTIEASFERTREAAIAAIEKKLTEASNEAVARTLAEIETRLDVAAGQLAARAEAAASTLSAATAEAAAVIPAPALATPSGVAEPAHAVAPVTPSVKPEPRRKRTKPEAGAPDIGAPSEVAAVSSSISTGTPTTPPVSAEPPVATPTPTAAAPVSEVAVAPSAPADEPRPTPPEAESPGSAPPDAPSVSATPTPLVTSVEPLPESAASAAPEAPTETPESVRKRPRKASTEAGPLLFPGLLNDDAPVGDEFAQAAPDEGGVKSALSTDGATRLIATAYIGIGNKLFLRGDGPGLSWDKGVPLQFVSIGKWRWETADAAAPITAKLYKNDQVECTGLGTVTLEPGHQSEVTANFAS
ncbi:MAG TPA: hypothetical protein VGD81_01280 [Opitutaceae bacterium]